MAQLEAIESAVHSVDALTGADARRARKLRLELRAIPVDGPKIVGDDARRARKLRQQLKDADVKKDGSVVEAERLAKIAEAAAKRRERIARRQANEEKALLGLDETPQASPVPEASPAPDASPSSAANDDAPAEPEEPKVIRRIVDESISYDITAAKVLDEVLAREAQEEAKRRFELDKSILNNLELWNKPPEKRKKKKKKDKKEKKKKRKRSSSSGPSDACSDSRSLSRPQSQSRSRTRSKSRSALRETKDDE